MPRLAGIEAELSRAEFDKYAAPILLLHGLWAGPWIWHPSASYLAHRGWNSHALAWHGEAHSWSELLTLAQRAVDELGRPVVIGHDLGALAALHLRNARSAVAISPLPGGASAPAHPFFQPLSARLARWRGAEIRPSDKLALRVAGVAAAKLTPESSRWLEEIASIGGVTASHAAPRLVVGGDADPCASQTEVESIASRFGAELKMYPAAGHDLPYGARWQATAADVHRWLVRRLGEDLLLLRGDEDLRDD